jgi:hypothetical protein
MSRAVRFRELSLTGFGLWKEATRFRFPARLGVLVRPNESGKSTMVTGLRAVLFGLKDGPDAYRSWGGSAACKGRLDLDTRERRIRVARDFLSHATTLQELDAEGRAGALVFEGVPNPRGRTQEKERYNVALGEILGDLADGDLFASAFMITQSTLPGANLGESLRRLVSGVGRVGGDEARALLFERAKKLTRATGEMRLVAPGKDQPRNQGTDGEIERIAAQIDATRRLLESSAGDFDRQYHLEARGRAAGDSLAAAETEQRNAKADRDQLESYRESAKLTDAARTAYAELKTTLGAFDAAIEEAEKAEADDAAARAADSPTNVSRWDRISAADGGSDPVAWVARVRGAAERWLDAVSRLRGIEETRKETLAERDTLSAVAVLPSEVQEMLARLQESIEAIEQKASLAERNEESRRALAEEAARKRADFERRYAPLEGIDGERIISLLDERTTVYRKITTIEADSAAARAVVEAGARPRWPRALAIGLPAGGAIGGILAALNAPPIAAGLAGAVVAGILFFLLSRPPRALRAARGILQTASREIEAARARLQMEVLPPGPWLPDDEGAADRAREIYRNRDADAASLAETEAAADTSSLELAERERRQAREERRRLEEQAQGIEEATGRSAPDAVRAYRDTSARLHQIEEQLREARLAIAAGEHEDPLEAPIAEIAPQWTELSDAVPVLGIAAATLGELHGRLSAMTSAEWDATEAEARTHVSEREGRVLRAAEARRRAAELLRTARGGPFADRSALADAIDREDERRRDASSSADKTIAASDLVGEYAQADGSAKDEIRRRIENRASAAVIALERSRQEDAEARAMLAAWQPPEKVNLAALDVRIAELESRKKTLERRRDAVAQAWFILGDAVGDFASAHRETLEENLDRRFRGITNRASRRVRLGDHFDVVITEEAAESNEDSLSQGARDQLAFCLRLAVADLVAGDLLLPLILDDPFVHSDSERLERIRESLEAAAEERQVILLTQDRRFADWGEAIDVEGEGIA